jgi:hypothetical protein
MANILHALSIAVGYAAPSAYYFSGSKWFVPVLTLNSFIPLFVGILMVWLAPDAVAVAAGVNVATLLAIFIWLPSLGLAVRKVLYQVNRV